MAFAVVLTLLVGVSIVAQGAVNAKLIAHANLWLLLTIGNVICAAGSLIAWAATRTRGSWWEELSRVPPAVLIPSVAGFAIIAGMPLAIGRIGVFRSVILVIAVQIIAGLIWDRVASGQAISALRITGAALVFGGGLLVMRG